MAGMYGADVAQLRQLAKQFDDSAGRLDADRLAVGNGIQISAWVGPAAVRFRHQWDSEHSARLHTAAARLREAAGKLRANADDQERTSAVSGSGGGLPAFDPRGSSGPTASLPDWSRFPEDMRRNLQSLVEAITGSKVAGLNPWEMLQLVTKAADVAGVDVGFFSFFDKGFTAIDLINGVIDGDPEVVYGLSHLGADAVSASPNPVLKLIGLNMHVWTDVAEEASRADFSAETRTRVGDYMVNNPAETIGVIGESTIEVGRRLVGWLPIP